jgi:aspartate-semialdehyde dehydrogenase
LIVAGYRIRIRGMGLVFESGKWSGSGDLPTFRGQKRIPVALLGAVSVGLTKKASFDEVQKAFSEYLPPLSKMSLPTAPRRPVYFFDQPLAPQSRFHRVLEGGMAVAIGSLRQCPLLDYKFFVLSNTSMRGSAGASVLIAELLVKEGKVSV